MEVCFNGPISPIIPCIYVISFTCVLCCFSAFLTIKNSKFSTSLSLLSPSHSLSPEKRLRSWPKAGNSPAAKNPVVRSKSYNVPMLTPVVEYVIDSSTGGGIRRHSVCEMTSCVEESGSVAESTNSATNNTSTSSLANHSPAFTASAALSGTTLVGG